MNRILKSSVIRTSLHSLRDNIDYPRTTQVPLMTRTPQRQLRFQSKSEAPQAYTQVYEFPEWYRPWTSNYRGDGLLLGTFTFMFWAYYSYDQFYLKKTEQVSRPNRTVYPQ